MSTNHNRIRVADLETNQPNKILITNQKGELEFSDNVNVNLASDLETQISNSIPEDQKVVSRLKLFNWWQWIKNFPLKWENTISASPATKDDELVTLGQLSSSKPTLDQVLAAGDYAKNKLICLDEGDAEYRAYFGPRGYSAGHGLSVSGITSLEGIQLNTHGSFTGCTFVSEERATQRNEIFMPNKSGTVALKNDFVQTAVGTENNAPIIIPIGTLTTIPQDGAIERDENGQLWETHGGVRSKLVSGNNTLGIELKGEFNNNGEAIAANLKVGDFYSLPITISKQASYVAVVKDTTPPAYMKLSFSNIDASCVSLGITDKNSISNWNTYFTSKGSENFTSVAISGNDAQFITNNQASIKNIVLKDSQLINIDFVKLTAITTIDLSNNKLTEFNPTIMPTALINLILTNNLILAFNPSKALPNSLKKLTLNKNKIVEFEPDQKLPDSIEELNFEENLLASFGDNIEMPIDLKMLNLNKNKISDFYMEIPENLEILLLSGNRLCDFEPEYNLRANLKLLDLSHNQFSYFDPNNLLPDGVEVLKLSHNKMDDFEPMQSLPSCLKRLELNDNDLVTFNPKHLAEDQLETLLLHNNKIVNFNPENLNDTLHKLTLSNNKIASFNPILISNEINTISLENNPITTSSWNTNILWMENLNQGGTLYVGGTIDSIDGTMTKSILTDMKWSILKTPCPNL